MEQKKARPKTGLPRRDFKVMLPASPDGTGNPDRTSICRVAPQHWSASGNNRDLESGVNADPHAITLLLGTGSRCRGKGVIAK